MKRIKILAVDDQEFNLDLIELAFMEDINVQIMRAINGQEALEILDKDADIHVILLDLAMPVMNGFETLLRLKANRVWSQIPTIVIIANTEEKHRALHDGASDFLCKPIDVEEVRLRTFIHAKIKDLQDQLKAFNQ